MSAATAEQCITRILGDDKTVTFRQVSRQIGCHVHAAKNFLQDYLASHPDVVPTYLLSGPLLSTATVARTSIANEAPTHGTQSLAHMSATQKLRIVDMDQMSDDERNSEADAEEERAEIELEESGSSINAEGSLPQAAEEVPKWGVILTGQEALEDKKKLFIVVNVHVYALSSAPIKDSSQLLACAISVREQSSRSDPSLLGTISGESLVARPAPMRDGGMKFGAEAVPKAKVKQAEVDIKSDTTQQSKKQGKASQLSRKSSSKRRVILSDDEEDVPPESTREAPPTKASSSKLEPTSSMVRAADQAAMEAMMDMDFDFDDEEPPVVATETKAGKTKRKMRRVKKSKVEMDEKGYMVTKDYYEDEPCSGSETDTDVGPSTVPATTRSKPTPPVAMPKATPSASTTNKKAPAKKAMGQSTLAGFFKKK